MVEINNFEMCLYINTPAIEKKPLRRRNKNPSESKKISSTKFMEETGVEVVYSSKIEQYKDTLVSKDIILKGETIYSSNPLIALVNKTTFIFKI